MATYIRIDPPAAIPTQVPTKPKAKPTVTFKPASKAIITKILGHVALGLADLTIDDSQVPILLYKWSTFMYRMNDWMKASEKDYPKFLQMPRRESTRQLILSR